MAPLTAPEFGFTIPETDTVKLTFAGIAVEQLTTNL